MDQTLQAQYVAVETSLKELELQKEMLRTKILHQMMDSKVDKIESEVFGTFSIARRSSWTYSDKVNDMDDKLKIAKIREQTKGTAIEKVSESLRYTPTK